MSLALLATPRNLTPCPKLSHALIDAGHDFWRRGWSLGTSSNYSVVIHRDPLTLLMTGSGFDKGHLRPENFVLVDAAGRALTAPAPKPSAEALLHVALAQHAGAGAILHTHSVAATVLSAAAASAGLGHVRLAGFEMLKGLAGITTHDTTIDIEVFPNTQDIPALAATLATRLNDPVNPLRHGFLLAGHGLYTWGEDLAAARRHVEVLEFLFDVLTRQAALPSLR